MITRINFPPVNVINVPSSGILWDFSSRKNVYYTNQPPTLTIELSTEEFEKIHEVLEGIEIKRIGSYSYEVKVEGNRILTKIEVEGKEVNIKL